MSYLCTHCKKFVPARLVTSSASGPMVGPHKDCVGYHPAKRVGKPKEISPVHLEKGYLGRMMYDRSPGAVDKIVAALEEKVRMLSA